MITKENKGVYAFAATMVIILGVASIVIFSDSPSITGYDTHEDGFDCSQFFGDDWCDDSPADCGGNYKVGSIDSCNECQTGGFDCGGPNISNDYIHQTLIEGVNVTWSVAGIDYEITLDFVDPNTAKFTVNGESTIGLSDTKSYKLSDGSTITVIEILYQDFAGGVKAAEFTLAPSGVTVPNILPNQQESCDKYFGDSVCDDSPADCGIHYSPKESLAVCDECQTIKDGNPGFNCAGAPPSGAPSECTGYYGDDYCDDSPAECGVDYKVGSVPACNECQTGGFDCGGGEGGVVPAPTSPPNGTCQNKCGEYNPGASCQCDAACLKPENGDCCSDYKALCVSPSSGGPLAAPLPSTTSVSANNCQGKCSNAYNPELSCQCDAGCIAGKDCCLGPDGYESICVEGAFESESLSNVETTASESKKAFLAQTGKIEIKKGQTIEVWTGAVGVKQYDLKLVGVSSAGATIKVTQYPKGIEGIEPGLKEGDSTIIAGLDVLVESFSSNGAILWIGAEWAPNPSSSPSSGLPNLKIDSVDYGSDQIGIKSVWGTVDLLPIPAKRDLYFHLNQDGSIKSKLHSVITPYDQQIKVVIKFSNTKEPVSDEFLVRLEKLKKGNGGWDKIQSKKSVLIKPSGSIFLFIEEHDLHEGNNNFRVILDSKGEIFESNENDNEYLFDILVKKI